ncbi:hypothetical protein [Novacetimonas maltaceti]|uniref:hypothetical protein n=1 Tax=Novacetimonas maltaceti TaxID=1203393 RepID=UPI00142E468A|nr:hypothetical protein [Novacetimonas maltaceti]
MSPGFFTPIVQKFLVKLFSKSFGRRRLFEKRRHPKTFIMFIGGFLKQSPKVIVAA